MQATSMQLLAVAVVFYWLLNSVVLTIVLLSTHPAAHDLRSTFRRSNLLAGVSFIFGAVIILGFAAAVVLCSGEDHE